MAEAAVRVSPQPDADPGVVAAGVYCRRAPRPRHRDRGGRRMGEEARPRRLDRPARAGRGALRRVQAQFGLHELAIEDARHAHQRPKIEQYGDGALRRRAHGPDRRRPHRLRRDPSLRRPRLRRLGAPRRVDLLRRRAPALRGLPEGALPRRGLHPLRHPRLHRRQLHAGDRDDPRRGRGDRGPRARRPRSARREVERLYMLRRDLLRLRNAVVPLVEVCRRLEHAEVLPRSTPPCSRSSATSPTMSAACRRRSIRCARCSPSPSRRA